MRYEFSGGITPGDRIRERFLQENLNLFIPGEPSAELGDKGFMYRLIIRDITGHDNTYPLFGVHIRCCCKYAKNDEQYSHQRKV